jgi:hypothetical protein
MVDNGFDTEGVVAKPRTTDIEIQCALMIGGVVYSVDNPVTLKVSKNEDGAQISTRRIK